MTFTRKSRVIAVTSALFATLALLITAGCAVGPNFKRPAAPNVPGYAPSLPSTTSSSPGFSGGEPQTFAQGRDIPGDWWTLFHSKPLNDLIERSLKNNPDLKSAQAALLVARENVLVQRGAYYPQVSGSFSATRAKTSEEISPVPSFTSFQYSLFTPEVSVSYIPDVFGLNRRTVESLKAQQEQARLRCGRNEYHLEFKRCCCCYPGGISTGAD